MAINLTFLLFEETEDAGKYPPGSLASISSGGVNNSAINALLWRFASGGFAIRRLFTGFPFASIWLPFSSCVFAPRRVW
jgi:hypothetical protein